MNDKQAKDLQQRIEAVEIIPMTIFSEIPKCWHHYLTVKLELIKLHPAYSVNKRKSEEQFINTLNILSSKYSIDDYEDFFRYYLDRFESAREYQERKLWEVH